jgi:hypothetical protein
LPLVGGTHACHGAQQRGLARAIGADDGRPAAFGNLQTDLAQHLALAQLHAQGLGRQSDSGLDIAAHAPSPDGMAPRLCISHSR